MAGIAIIGLIIAVAVAIGRLGGGARSGGRRVGAAGITYDPRQGDAPPRDPMDWRPTENGTMSGCGFWLKPPAGKQ